MMHNLGPFEAVLSVCALQCAGQLTRPVSTCVKQITSSQDIAEENSFLSGLTIMVSTNLTVSLPYFESGTCVLASRCSTLLA
jgi:hypothetical protein